VFNCRLTLINLSSVYNRSDVIDLAERVWEILSLFFKFYFILNHPSVHISQSEVNTRACIQRD